jgi:hypothetical protein
MQSGTKAQISKITLSLLTIVCSLFLLGVLVLVLCVGLNINPFKETTTALLGSAFAGLIGVASVLVLLNVATNVSLIADAKIAELHIEIPPGRLRRWVIAFFTVAVLLVSLIFVGTYLSKERYLGVVHAQAEGVLKANSGLLEEISRLLASGKPEDYKRVSEIRTFLESQRDGLPDLTIIYSGKFGDKLALYQISGGYFPPIDAANQSYTPVYFKCAQDRDCDYLTQFFSGENSGELRKYTMRDDQFYIYIPYAGGGARFVLLFDRWNRYGKIGS